MEVARRRQKQSSPCNENWKTYDNEVRKKHIDTVGCAPPYLGSVNDPSKCSSKHLMKQAMFNLRTDHYGLTPPCRTMENIYYTFEESDLNVKEVIWARKGRFWIGIYLMNPEFKEILETR